MEVGCRNQLGSRENNTGRTSYVYFIPIENTLGPLEDSSDGDRKNPHPKSHLGTYFGHLACISGDRVDGQCIWSWKFFCLILNEGNTRGSVRRGPF